MITKEIKKIIESVEPTPITEEWLIDLGFSSGALDSYSIYYHKKVKINGYGQDFCIRFYRDGFAYYCNGNEQNSSYKRIDFKHQLELIFYSLTGLELK